MDPYFSFDMETTGDDPMTHQILEIGVIFENPNNPLPFEQLPKFNVLIKHDLIKGNAFALKLNVKILEKLAKPSLALTTPIVSMDVALNDLKVFLHEHATPPFKMIGKNFAGFDLQFLRNENPIIKYLFHHRVLDVGSLFFNPPFDPWIPSTDEVLRRAKIAPMEAHTAIGDSWDMIRAVRWKIEQNKPF